MSLIQSQKHLTQKIKRQLAMLCRQDIMEDLLISPEIYHLQM